MLNCKISKSLIEVVVLFRFIDSHLSQINLSAVNICKSANDRMVLGSTISRVKPLKFPVCTYPKLIANFRGQIMQLFFLPPFVL